MIARIAAMLQSLWWNLARRDRVDAALDDEVRAYVELLAAEYEREGMSPLLARRRALIETGGVQQVKEATRRAWVGDTIASTARELRFTIRGLRRAPVFLAVAVITLAIGIGGATAVFTVIDASLLRPLPQVSEPEQLVTVERVQPTGPAAEFSYPDYRDLKERASTLAGLAAFNGTSMALEDAAGSERAWVGYVSDDFFQVLGVRPAAGRLFQPSGPSGKGGEAEAVAIIGHALWQRRFAGAATVIGSTVKLDGRTFTIVGIAPPGFIGAMRPNPMELWIPITVADAPAAALSDFDFTSRRDAWLRLVGRVAPGRSVEEAQRELAAIATQLATAHPATNEGRSVHVAAGAGMTAEERAELSRVPRLLAGAVVLLLLIACGNVAGLSLVRAAARRRELATRLALGASRGVLVRMVALEGAVVALAAGLLGVVLARLLVGSTALVQSVIDLDHLDLRIDWRVLGVALAASVMTAMLVAILPAMQLAGLPPGAVLKDGGAGALRRRRGQRMLVAAQVGACVILLAAASIVHSAFQRVLTAHDASDPRTLTDIGLEIRESLPDTAERLAFYRSLLERAEAEPGIAHVALTSTIPPFQWATRAAVFRRGEEPPADAPAQRDLESAVRAQAVSVSEGFFDVMRIAIVRGRGFAPSDDERSPPVVILSRRLADALWPGENPLDRSVVWPGARQGAPRPLRVVGVVGDTRDLSPSAPPPFMMYLPFAQRPTPHILVVRSRTTSPVPPATLRRLVADVDPRVAALGGRILHDRLRGEARPQRTASAWIAVFGAIALLLASVGLYGVVAQGVAQRRREIAVRSALGATPRNILNAVLGDGMRLVAIGSVIGGFGAVAAFRVLRSLFTGVEAVNLLTIGGAAMLLVVTTVIATWVPAHRASRLDPVEALRSE